MGFKLLEGDQKGHFVIEVSNEEAPKGVDGTAMAFYRQEFVACVQKALSSSKLDLAVDFTKMPSVLQDMVLELLSLQKVLVNHQKSLKVRGAFKALTDVIIKLRKAQIDVVMQSVENEVEVGAASVEVPAVDLAITQNSESAKSLLELRVRLAEKIAQKRGLEAEKKFYEARFKSLEEGHQPSTGSSEKLVKVMAIEQELQVLTEESHRLTKQSDELELISKATETETKEQLSKLKDELKKKRDLLEKKNNEIKSKTEKLRVDIEKKAEQKRLASEKAVKDKPEKPSG